MNFVKLYIGIVFFVFKNWTLKNFQLFQEAIAPYIYIDSHMSVHPYIAVRHVYHIIFKGA